MDLRELARPRLTQLMDTTGLLCHLGLLITAALITFLKVESSATISVRSHEGKSLSLYRSNRVNACLLATCSCTAKYYRRAGLGTGDTHNDYSSTTALRRTGAYSPPGLEHDNGSHADVRCVAAPVFNANNELTAAISVVGTRLQINEEYRDYLAGKAIACARDISRCWDGKVPLTYRPHNNENIVTTKIKQVRAWFTGSATAEKGAGGGDYHDQGRITELMIILPPDEVNTANTSSPAVIWH